MDYSNLPKYTTPISTGHEPIVAIEYWDEAYDAFERKDYKQSLIGVLNFINPSLLENINTNKEIEFSQAHGSADIRINISEKTFKIVAPFLKIGNANKVAIMRRIAEMNFTLLTLSQVILKDDVLWFEYSTPIELCQPNKIHEVIREVCLFSDEYDDEFINKYKAEFIHKPKVTPLPPSDQKIIWQHFQETAEQYQDYLTHFEQKRWRGSVWEIIVISILKLASTSYIHGALRSELSDTFYSLYDGDIDADHRIDKGKKFLKKLFSISEEDFMKNVYSADQFISSKKRSSSQILQNEFEKSREEIFQEINEGNNFSAAYSIYVLLLRFLYEYNLDDGHRNAIIQALEKAGGKDSVEAIDILQGIYIKFLQGTIDSKLKNSFFSKLFG